MKIKGDEYVRLHRILTNVSNRDIWEYLKDGKPMDEILDKVPDEFYDWVRNTKNELLTQYQTLEREYQWIFKIINRVPDIGERKVFAEYAKRYKHPSLLFNMLDGRDYSEQIWKLIYPSYSKPFKKDEEN
jgi:RNA ligase